MDGRLLMNRLFSSFGLFEWILTGGLVGLGVYFFRFCFRNGTLQWLKKALVFVCISLMIVSILSLNDDSRSKRQDPVSINAIDPLFNASLTSNNENKKVFTPVSALRSDLFREVSSPTKEKSIAVSNFSQQNSNNPVSRSGAVPASNTSVPQQDNRGIVSAELTTTINESTDSIIQARFQSQSIPIPSPNLDTVDSEPSQINFTDNSKEDIARALEVAKLATVQIEAKIRKSGNKGIREADETGSGFIIMTRSGSFYVLTNNHVAGNPVSNEQVNIILNDKRLIHPVHVISSEEFDLAVLELDKRDILPDALHNADSQTLNNLFHSSGDSLSWNPANLGNSDQVRVTESVWVIGSPFGLEGTVTSGIVSGLDRHNIPLGTEHQIQGFIQTDASVNPGNSGGPLVNARGEVIGVMIAIASKTGESSGVSFAIPINNAIHVAEQLIRNGGYQHPYIGLKLDRLFDSAKKIQSGLLLDSVSIAGNAKRAAGTRVTSVVPGSPAAVAGLREGDIIIRYNNKTVDDEQHFEYMISLSNINEVPKIEILRNGQRYIVSPKLTDRNQMKVQNVSVEKDY